MGFGLRQRTIVVLLLVLLLAGIGYALGLTSYQAYDDEGGYLYAAWRIAEGEMPYRDFLTPQLPGFLYPGALLFALTDGSVWWMRFSMVALVLLTALVGFLLMRRVANERAAFFSLLLFLAHHETFFATRFFRPEAGMLFWGVAGYALYALGHHRRRSWLVFLAGVALGLATMTKLFGALMAAGLGLWAILWAWRSPDRRAVLRRVGWFVVGYLALVAGVVGVYSALEPGFLGAVVGHHLGQGAGTPWREVISKAFLMYWEAVRTQPVYMLLAVVGVGVAYRQKPALGLALACQVATALVFAGMTRDLQLRHLTYLVPALAALGGVGLEGLAERIPARGWGRALGAAALVLLAGLALYPEHQRNVTVGRWREEDTPLWVAFLNEITDPSDYVLSDYPGINVAARRRTTPLGSGLSEGATDSGQITGRDLIQEIEAYDVQVVLLNVGPGAHQLVSLVDYDEWKQYVQTHFHLVGRPTYDSRPIEVYARDDRWPGETTDYNFGNALALTGYQWETPAAEPGHDLRVLVRWQALAALPVDFHASLQLVDSDGQRWGLGSKALLDMDAETYLDERNIEVAILRPSSQWPAGETSLQIHELPIEPATPPGTYQVIARVHLEERWTGLPVLGDNGERIGYDVDLGAATVLPASNPGDVNDLPIHTRLDQALAPGVELLGVSPVPERALPGDTIELSLWWRCTEPGACDQRLQLDLGEAGVAGHASGPVAGPTGSVDWRPGELLRQQIRLRVDREVTPGSYALRACLDPGDASSSSALLGTVTVDEYVRQFRESILPRAASLRFGQAIELVGYHTGSSSRGADQAPRLTLYWRALRPMDISYTVSVRITDMTGRVVVQQDHIPGDGVWPTTAWLPGEYVTDVYRFGEPVELPPGRYQLAVVLYDLETGVQLDVTWPSGEVAEGGVIAQFDVE